MFAELLECGAPEAVKPGTNLAEPMRVYVIDVARPPRLGANKLRVAEHFEMLRDGRTRDRKMLGQRPYRAGMRREQYGVQDSWHAEHGWVDGCTYAILRSEWEGSEGQRVAAGWGSRRSAEV